MSEKLSISDIDKKIEELQKEREIILLNGKTVEVGDLVKDESGLYAVCVCKLGDKTSILLKSDGWMVSYKSRLFAGEIIRHYDNWKDGINSEEFRSEN